MPHLSVGEITHGNPITFDPSTSIQLDIHPYQGFTQVLWCPRAVLGGASTLGIPLSGQHFFDRVKLIIQKEFHHFLYGGFLKWWYPKMDGFLKGKTLLKWMIWGYQTTIYFLMDDLGGKPTILGNIHMLATTKSSIRLAPPQKWPKNPREHLFCRWPPLFFFKRSSRPAGFWGDTGFSGAPPFWLGDTGVAIAARTMWALQVPEGWAWRWWIFNEGGIFVWKIHVGVFFLGKKMTGHFSSALFFFFRKWTILAWPSVTRIICWIKLVISPGFQPVSTLFVGSSSEISESHWLCLLQRLIPYWF